MMAMDINGLVSIHDPAYIEGDGDGLGKRVVICRYTYIGHANLPMT